MPVNLTHPTRRRLLRVAVGAFALATLVVLGTATQNYVEASMRQADAPAFWRFLPYTALWWYAWVPISVGVFELGWRFPLERRRIGARLGLLAAGFVGAYALDVAIQVAAMYLPYWSHEHETLQEAVVFHAVTSLYLNVFIYWAVIALSHGVRAYAESQQRALNAARLEAELTEARMDVLRMQLHPHFLFNAMHGISELIHSDPQAADTMVSRLAQLLRRALDRTKQQIVTLQDEVDFLRDYLAFEQVRFGERLQVSITIPEEAETLAVPTFLLQPLVENSIKHGVRAGGNRGRIEVSATVGDHLILLVRDDGPGMDDGDAALTSGVGLSNLDSRLRARYGSEYRLHIGPAPQGGTLVTIQIPREERDQGPVPAPRGSSRPA